MIKPEHGSAPAKKTVNDFYPAISPAIFVLTIFSLGRPEFFAPMFPLTPLKLKEDVMDKEDLKKLLAALSVAGLIAGAGLTMTGCASA